MVWWAPSLLGHGVGVPRCWDGSDGDHSRLSCLPDTFPRVGGFRYTKVSTSQQYQSLLPLKQNPPSISVACRACNQHCRPQALSCGSKAKQALVHGPGGQGDCPGPLRGRAVPGPAGEQDSSVPHPHLSHARPRPLSPSMCPCCFSPLDQLECLPWPCHPGMPFMPWLLSSCIAAAK